MQLLKQSKRLRTKDRHLLKQKVDEDLSNESCSGESDKSVESQIDEGLLRVALPLPPILMKHKGPQEERVYQQMMQIHDRMTELMKCEQEIEKVRVE